MSKYICPLPLKKGDKTIIISPSGNTDPSYIDTAKKVLESWGLLVETGIYSYGKCGRYGGTREQRIHDLQSALNASDIRLVFCSRGGYGAVQLLDYLDYNVVRQYPKWLAGFSDITALHLAFLKNGIISLHAPMAHHLSEHADNEATGYLREILFSGNLDYKIKSHPYNKAGKVNGRLFGGNMAVMCGLIGTPYFTIPPRGILFIEDIAELPYNIDRMMWLLKLSGVLKKISGLIVGQFSGCEEDPLMGKTIYESIRDMVSEYDYPVAFNFPVGHVQANYPMPYGGRVSFKVAKDFVTVENIK